MYLVYCPYHSCLYTFLSYHPYLVLQFLVAFLYSFVYFFLVAECMEWARVVKDIDRNLSHHRFVESSNR